MSDRILVIDDVDHALRLMTDLGRRVASPAALNVRRVVLDYAAKRGWTVISYSAFENWAIQMMTTSRVSWIVLDPLFASAGAAPPNLVRFRLSRVGQLKGFSYGEGWSDIPDGDIAVLDDAVASGFTLRHVTRWIEAAARSVQQYLVCASTRLGRDNAMRETRQAKWCQLMPGDWTPIHLRDGCAHLPFSGARINLDPIRTETGAEVELRSPVMTLTGTPWHSLSVILPIHAAIRESRQSVAQALGYALSRPALVSDLPSLGHAVPALLDTERVPDAATRLLDLV